MRAILMQHTRMSTGATQRGRECHEKRLETKKKNRKQEEYS